MKNEAIRSLGKLSAGCPCSCGFSSGSNGGVCFWVRRGDKRRAYYSGNYRGLADAKSDLDFLLKWIGGQGVDERTSFLLYREREYVDKHRKD
jgi:hypothetical protein